MCPEFVFRNAKYSLRAVAFFCLLFGTGQSNAQTLSGHDSAFLSVENAGKTRFSVRHARRILRNAISRLRNARHGALMFKRQNL